MVIHSPEEVRVEDLRVDEHPQWSPTRISVADRCMAEYAFNYVIHLEHEVPSVMVRGKVLHTLFEKFWKEKDGILVPKYKSAEAFANTAKARWIRKKIEGVSDGQKIQWKYPGEEWDKKGDLEFWEMAHMAYNGAIRDGPPVRSELEFFTTIRHPSLPKELQGLRLRGKIDEVRDNLVFRDHKTGYVSLSSLFVNNNIQMTHYLIGVWQALQDINSPIFKEILPDYAGIPLDEFLREASIEINHIPTTRFMEDEDKPNESILYTGKRNIYHLRDLGALIRAKEGAIKRREFIRTSDTRACNFCFYKDHCREHHLEEYFEREFEKKSPLFSYAGMTPDAVRQSKPEKPRSKQKTMRLMKKDNTLRA